MHHLFVSFAPIRAVLCSLCFISCLTDVQAAFGTDEANTVIEYAEKSPGSISLAQALTDLAQIRKTQIVFFSGDVKPYSVLPVEDTNQSVEATIQNLILGTGLIYVAIDERTFAVGTKNRLNRYQNDAQVADNTGMEITPPMAEEITILGYRKAFENSLSIKRNAAQFIDAITSERIGHFPDQNVTEAIQRVPGVAITRSNGEGESIAIRGFSPLYARVEMDGRTSLVTVNSSDPDRGSSLAPFSSNIFQRIEIIKTPSAKDDSGGLAGIVRLHTPNPMEIGENRIGLESNIQQAENRDDMETRGSGYFVKLSPEEEFGLLMAFTYEDLDRRIDKIRNTGGWVPLDQTQINDGFVSGSDFLSLTSNRFMSNIRHERRGGKRNKANYHFHTRYEPSNNMHFYLNGLATREKKIEQISRLDTLFNSGHLIDSEVSSSGVLGYAEFAGHRNNFNNFSRTSQIDTLGLTLGHSFWRDAWEITTEIAHSDSSESRKEQRARARMNSHALANYNFREDGRYPAFESNALLMPLNQIFLRDLTSEHRKITQREDSLSIDLKWLVDSDYITAFDFGAKLKQTRFERQQTDTFYNTKTRNGVPLHFASGPPLFSDSDFGFGGGGTHALRAWPSVIPSSLIVQSAIDGHSSDPNTYSIRENSTALYAMLNFDGEIAGIFSAGNLGLRAESIHYKGEGRTVVDGVVRGDPFTLSNRNTKTLFSSNVVLSGEAESRFKTRIGIAQAMNLPSIDEIRPFRQITTSPALMTERDAKLEPFMAWQYDLSLEYYFNRSQDGLLALSLFRKSIDNLITVHSSERHYSDASLGVPENSYTTTEYRNEGRIDILGYEFSLQTPFTFLEGPWSNFGVSFNLTALNPSESAQENIISPLPKDNEFIFNTILFYDSDKISGRLAYNYRDDFLDSPSDSPDGLNSVYGDDEGRLDFSFRYLVNDNWTLMFDALNLTQEQRYLYYDTPAQLMNLEIEGRIYSFGVHLQF